MGEHWEKRNALADARAFPEGRKCINSNLHGSGGKCSRFFWSKSGGFSGGESAHPFRASAIAKAVAYARVFNQRRWRNAHAFYQKAEPSADAKALAKAEAKAEAKAGATSKALCVGHCYMIAKAETQAGAEERALSAKSVGKSARAS